jgi:OFA family oxalate/formate antiporter-like MFS transporter
MTVSVLVASFCSSWLAFVLVYSIGFPAGIGIVYWVPITCGWEWFPDSKGLVSGCVVAGYGFGAFIFGFISTAIANPDNLTVSVPDYGPPTLDKLFPI